MGFVVYVSGSQNGSVCVSEMSIRFEMHLWLLKNPSQGVLIPVSKCRTFYKWHVLTSRVKVWHVSMVLVCTKYKPSYTKALSQMVHLISVADLHFLECHNVHKAIECFLLCVSIHNFSSVEEHRKGLWCHLGQGLTQESHLWKVWACARSCSVIKHHTRIVMTQFFCCSRVIHHMTFTVQVIGS